MRIATLIIVFTHGLIHLLGFFQALDILDLPQSILPASRPFAGLSLTATILFGIFGFLFWTKNRNAWLSGILAALISQIVILNNWAVASWGTLPNLIILLVAIMSLGASFLFRKFVNSVKEDFKSNNSSSTDILTEEDIAHLPSIVQRYLSYTQSVGQPKVKNFYAELAGGMRSNPGEPYMEVKAVQYNFFQRPSRYFYMTAEKMGLPATGLHLYQNAQATFQVKLLNWLTVVDAQGEKMNQGETVTFLNDMCVFAPATLIDKRLEWEEVNPTTVNVRFKNAHIWVSATLYFNKAGALLNFISKDRFETDGKEYINSPWATPLEGYQPMNSYLLPTKGQLIYQRPEGDFMYGELTIKNVVYNLREIKEDL